MRLWRRDNGGQRVAERAAAAWRTLRGFFEPPPRSEVPVDYDADYAEQFPAVAAAVRLFSTEIARTEIVVEGEGEDKYDPVPKDDADQRVLGEQWSPTRGKTASLVFAMRSLLLYGFGACWIDRTRTGGVGRILPLNPMLVTREAVGGVIKYGWSGLDRQVPSVLPREDLIWLDWVPPWDGFSRMGGPVERSWTAVRAALTAQEWSSTYFASAARPEVLYSVEPGETVAADDLWYREDKMRSKGRSSLLLPVGVKPTVVGGDPTTAKLIGVLEYGIQDVARVFGMTPIALQELSRGTYSNYPASLRFLARFSIGTLAEQWSDALTAMIYPADMDAGGMRRRVRLDLGDIGDESISEKWTRLGRAVGAGLMTANEARKRVGLPRSDAPGADDLVRSPTLLPDDLLPMEGPDDSAGS